MSIRKFKEKDATNVSKLIKETLANTNSKDYSKEVIDFMINYFSSKKIIENSKTNKTYVFEENQTIIGTGSVCNNQIFTVFVDSKSQKKGIGKQIVKYLEDIIKKKNYKEIILRSSITAILFYEKLGYNQVEEINDENFGTTILMQKEI